jgi:hypothetical protein
MGLALVANVVAREVVVYGEHVRPVLSGRCSLFMQSSVCGE